MDETIYPRRDLYVDYVYQLIKFAIDRGIPWDAIPYLFQLGVEVLDEMLKPDNDCTRVYENFQKRFQRILCMNTKFHLQPQMIVELCDYFVGGIFGHYHLFRYSFTRAQISQEGKIQLTLNLPPIPPIPQRVPSDGKDSKDSKDKEAQKESQEGRIEVDDYRLSAAKDYRLWRYEEDVREIERVKLKMREQRESAIDAFVQHKAEELERVLVEMTPPDRLLDKEV